MKIRQFKPYVPAPVWNNVRRLTVYLRRLRTWRLVLTQIEGLTPEDQAILSRSLKRGLLTAMRDLDAWQDPVLLDDANVVVKGIGRFHVRAHSDDLYHVLPSREEAVFRYLETHLSDGDRFIDAGANIGFYSVAAARKVGPGGHVIAIEMMPDTAEILRRHIALNDDRNVDIVEKALSDRSGDVVEASVVPGKYGQASIAKQKRAKPGRAQLVQVSTVTLDDLAAPLDGPIALIKLDLEGVEHLALSGASMTLARTGAVIFEQWGDDNRARSLLEQTGFKVRAFSGKDYVAER